MRICSSGKRQAYICFLITLRLIKLHGSVVGAAEIASDCIGLRFFAICKCVICRNLGQARRALTGEESFDVIRVIA